MRKAIVKNEIDGDRVQSYLPSNYHVALHKEDDKLVIYGEDRCGWTLDDYVLPRLASGLIFAEEIE